MAESKTTRLQVTVPTKLIENIDELCEVSGMSRAAYVEYVLGSSVSTYRKMVEGTVGGMVQAIQKESEE